MALAAGTASPSDEILIDLARQLGRASIGQWSSVVESTALLYGATLVSKLRRPLVLGGLINSLGPINYIKRMRASLNYFTTNCEKMALPRAVFSEALARSWGASFK